MKIQLPGWLRRREKQAQFSSFPAIPLQLFPEAARDRQPMDLQTVYQQSLDIWRSNPLARRIVGLTSQYVVGGGVRFHCDHEGTRVFLEKWWQIPGEQLVNFAGAVLRPLLRFPDADSFPQDIW